MKRVGGPLLPIKPCPFVNMCSQITRAEQTRQTITGTVAVTPVMRDSERGWGGRWGAGRQLWPAPSVSVTTTTGKVRPDRIPHHARAALPIRDPRSVRVGDAEDIRARECSRRPSLWETFGGTMPELCPAAPTEVSRRGLGSRESHSHRNCDTDALLGHLRRLIPPSACELDSNIVPVLQVLKQRSNDLKHLLPVSLGGAWELQGTPEMGCRVPKPLLNCSYSPCICWTYWGTAQGHA